MNTRRSNERPVRMPAMLADMDVEAHEGSTWEMVTLADLVVGDTIMVAYEALSEHTSLSHEVVVEAIIVTTPKEAIDPERQSVYQFAGRTSSGQLVGMHAMAAQLPGLAMLRWVEPRGSRVEGTATNE